MKVMCHDRVKIHNDHLVPYSRKIWRFGGLYYNRQIKICQNFLLAYNIIRMAILYRTAKFKSANVLAIAIWAQPPNLIPANISGYTVYYIIMKFMCSLCILNHKSYDSFKGIYLLYIRDERSPCACWSICVSIHTIDIDYLYYRGKYLCKIIVNN